MLLNCRVSHYELKWKVILKASIFLENCTFSKINAESLAIYLILSITLILTLTSNPSPNLQIKY